MSKSIISTLLSTLFLVFLIAPTVILIIEDSTEVSTLYVSSEEEEKGNETNKDIETILLELINTTLYTTSAKSKNNSEYHVHIYSKLYATIISPPPESSFL